MQCTQSGTETDHTILNNSINTLMDIVFNPLIENCGFKQEYVEQEKENIKKIINSKIDNKDQYALDRCIEEMYKDKPYGLYKYGCTKDLDNISASGLYEYYKELISTAKIDIFVSGDFDENNVTKTIKDLKIIQDLNERDANYIPNTNNVGSGLDQTAESHTVTETMDVTQGKLVLGLKINETNGNCKFIASMYNAILGGTANSKMFQNVREKESLAYTANSIYIRQKNNVYIRCGIEINNYQKTVDIIKIQLEDMKNGMFKDEDVTNAKKYITSSVKMLADEQESSITYFIANELSNSQLSIEDYIDNVDKVTKEQIVGLAKTINLEMIYFLRD